MAPLLNTAGEEDEPETIRLSEARFLNLTLKNDQLLPEKCILSDELASTPGQIGGNGESHRVASGMCQATEKYFGP